MSSDKALETICNLKGVSNLVINLACLIVNEASGFSSDSPDIGMDVDDSSVDLEWKYISNEVPIAFCITIWDDEI